VLVVIDGAKALRKAVRDVLGVHTPVQRCVRHKERNVLGHLPERDRRLVRRRLRAAWALDDHDRALDQLRMLADELARSHPGAAASLREGMEETLTVTRLCVRGRLKRTLASTNPCESMIETVRRVARNVKRWQSGDMCLRWTAAGMLQAEARFRKIIGYPDLAKLAVAVERDVAAKRAADTPPTPVHTAIATAVPEVAASPARDNSLTGSPPRTSTASGTPPRACSSRLCSGVMGGTVWRPAGRLHPPVWVSTRRC
jgi:hypothetical protein